MRTTGNHVGAHVIPLFPRALNSPSRKKIRCAVGDVDFFLTSFSIRRMLRDNTPVDSTESLQTLRELLDLREKLG